MSRWTIYSKWKDQAGRAVAKEVVVDGNIDDAGRYALPELEYNGTWMGETFVTLNIRCSEPINFEIGDYIVYRGEKFVMNYDPSVVKKARRGSYGEGFTYDNVKFNALNYELTDVRMLDYVIGDNGVHYSGLPTFQFFCSTVDDLCDRLQVNADRYCEENGISEDEWWVFVTPSETRTQQRCKNNAIKSRAAALYSTYFGDNMGDTASEKVNQNVSIDNMSVWDACKFIKETFGLNFISRERSIVVGAIGMPTEREFRYGLGNGLYEIERVADEDQAVITKLYAYGSDKNLPTRYYANIGVECYGYVAKWMQGEVKYLLLDIEYSGNYFTQKTTVNGQDCYAVRFTHGGVTYDAYVGSTDVIEGVTLSGFSVLFTDGTSLPFDGQEQLTFIGGVNKDAWPTDNTTQIHKVIPQNLPDNMAVSHLMLPGFPSESLYSWVKSHGATNSNDSTGLATWRGHTAYFSQDKERPYILSQYHTELGIREATKMFDGSDGTNEVYPTIENTEAGVIYAAETIKDNGVGTEMKNFTITLPDFGSDFDLKELLQSDTAIEMTDGYCGGRSFNVKSVKKEDGRWVCTCEREHDTALDLWFPYSYSKSIGGQERADEPYQVRTGDRYVLTGIEMTSTYVEAAATVLLEEALKFLEANEYVRYTYVPRVDEIFMARQHDGVISGDTATYGTRSYHDTLKEGDTLLFADDDLHITGSVFIDTLRIKEYGNGQIPTYELTLRNDKQVGTIERLQEQVSNISSTINNGGGGGGGVNIPLVRQLIQSYGGGMFLSKTSDDTANGVITFVRRVLARMGVQFGRYTGTALVGTGGVIDENGNAVLNKVEIRESLTVPTLVFNRAEVIAGTQTQTPFGGEIAEVVKQENGYGWARLRLEDGDVGRIRVGALCMGFFHNYGSDASSTNATADSDDRRGVMTWKGFSTVYFEVIEIPATYNDESNADNAWFRYQLRDTESGGNGVHPFVHMSFAGRGYVRQTGEAYDSIKQYQAFTIRTPFYTARLVDVGGWEWDIANYTYVNGLLDGFGELVNDQTLTGFGTIDMSIWLKGHIIQVDDVPDYISIQQSALGLLGENETETVWVRVYDGYRQNHTDAYTFTLKKNGTAIQKTITVANGEAWFTLSSSELGTEVTTFTVTATLKSDVTKTLEEDFTAKKIFDPTVTVPDRHEIELSDTVFHVDKDGTVTPSDIHVRVRNIHGDGTTSYMTDDDVDAQILYVWPDSTMQSGYDFSLANGIPSGQGYASLVDDVMEPEGYVVKDIKAIKAYLCSGAIEEWDDTADWQDLKGFMDINEVPLDIWDIKTIPVVTDGEDGKTTLIADFDDEMVSVPTDSTGKAQVDTSWNWQTTAHLYYGTEQLTLSSTRCRIVEATNNLWYNKYLTISSDGKTATLQVNGFDDMQQGSTVQPNTNNCKITIELVSADGKSSGTATAYVNKIPAGEGGDGKDAVIYSLSLDTNVVKYVNGVYTPGGIKVKIRETKGETVTEYNYDAFLPGKIGVSPSRNKWIYYKYDSKVTDYNDSSASSMESENIDAGGAHYIHITLWAGTGILLDSETIPIVRDGETPEVKIVNGQWYVNGNATGVSALGSDGDSVALQFSVNGSSNWHDTFGNGDLYAREVKIDGSGNRTYGTAFRIVGEKGDPGNPGNYTDYKFGRSAQATIDSSTTAPTIDGSWSDGMPVPSSAYPYIWMRKVLCIYNSSTGTYTEGTAYYTRVTGADGKDGKDAASYEYVRFSDNATLVDGVWTGTFTAADATQVTNKETAQGNTKNLIPYSEFEMWNSESNVPVGWVQHDNPETFMRQRDNDGVAWVRFSAIGGNTAKGFRLARDCDKDKGPLYLIPNTYGQTYNVSVRYKGNGRAMIVVHYWKWTEGTTTVSWLQTYAEYIYAEGYDDNIEHTITGTFTSRDSSATHFDIQLVHHYGMGSSSTTYEFAFAQPKVEIGSETTAYLPAPSEDLLGTTKGLWKGVMRWSHPYASSDFAQYEWNKVRDADPRMNTWNSENYVVPLGAPTDLQYYYCGAYGEPYYDIVYDGANYWMCKQTYRRDASFYDDTTQEYRYVIPENTDLWSIYWEMASQFNFLMAKTLYAINAFVERLVVRKLQTIAESGSCVEIQNGIINLWADKSDGTTNQSRFEFGTTTEGKAVLRYYDEDGTQLYDLGPNGITQELSSRNNVWTTKRLSLIRTDYNDGRPYPTGYIVQIRTNSSTVSDYHELTSEGYAMLSNNVKSYYFSGGTAPSDYEGRTFLREFTKTEAKPGYIPNGWYRAENTSGETFGTETTLDDGHGTTMTATTYSFQAWYYTDGKVTRQKLVQLELLSDGTGMVSN